LYRALALGKPKVGTKIQNSTDHPDSVREHSVKMFGTICLVLALGKETLGTVRTNMCLVLTLGKTALSTEHLAQLYRVLALGKTAFGQVFYNLITFSNYFLLSRIDT
jgi:hypothetical protein